MSEEIIESKEKQGGPSEAGEQRDGQRERKPYKPGPIMHLLAALVAACAACAGLLFLLTFASYRIRLSADVVRAGILGLYVLPCLIGGRMVSAFRLSPAPVWGILLGAAYYGVLLVVSWVLAGSGQHAGEVDLLVPALCTAGGLVGSLIGGKREKASQTSGN